MRTWTSTSLVAALAALLCAGCSSPTPQATVPPPSGSTPATSPSPPPGSGLRLPSASPITPTAPAGTPSTVPPPPTAPTAATTDFRDPVAVTRAWMTQWCASDYRQPRNNNVERATVFATTAGKTADLQAGDSEASHRAVVEQKLSTRCDRITAEIIPEAPRGEGQVYVRATATRTLLAADVAFQTEPVLTTRAVLRQPDGRWLVDVHVEAG
ncbi:hypothetical protein [Lentzea flaviverrucosa]|uniref:Mce-associated membrane protein n=1 Tax=Lentzea flaviverrucosa TaxID=200379 RepID=A0A1H9ERT9_9PSEU|nr:hypothetical protein [Lentzea flaviverrucosa]RDI35413.1 hypothetical protein DFR72_1011164 [Lentzea flaviverrucosa]SEQ28335.1 hypothetical protein SAMN05216195_10253 [Lentzea flaviverrucosa]